jgi:disulfide bond formation protein DsbB
MISPQVRKARNDLTASRTEYLSVLKNVQTGTGTHPASYFMDTSGFLLATKHSRHEADHSGPPSAIAKNKCSSTWTVSHMPTGATVPIRTEAHGAISQKAILHIRC